VPKRVQRIYTYVVIYCRFKKLIESIELFLRFCRLFVVLVPDPGLFLDPVPKQQIYYLLRSMPELSMIVRIFLLQDLNIFS
jgi:hypothetical protein